MTAHVSGQVIKTKILILSDTRGMSLADKLPRQSVDIVIHCGNLTDESKIDEFRTTLGLLQAIEAPLKLIIAGNHDFTLDTPIFKSKIEQARPTPDPELVAKAFGEYGEAERLLVDAKKSGIYLLNEGTHRFTLKNGSSLTVFASPFTPSLGNWGFQYPSTEGHNFHIEQQTDIAITHGPPRGMLDRTSSRDCAGCPDLFAAIAKAKPRIHCFGHIHESWGARLVAWKPTPADSPSFVTDVDNEKSPTIEQLSTLQSSRFDTAEDARRKIERVERYARQMFCSYDCGDTLSKGEQTLFVNASIKGDEEATVQLPWLVELGLGADAEKPQASVMKEREYRGRKRRLKRDLNIEPSTKRRRGFDGVAA